jgi:hypothetical protein
VFVDKSHAVRLEGLQYRTITGYKSMLSSVMSPIENFPVGQHPYITRLIKGVFNSRPPDKGNNKITELRTSYKRKVKTHKYIQTKSVNNRKTVVIIPR